MHFINGRVLCADAIASATTRKLLEKLRTAAPMRKGSLKWVGVSSDQTTTSKDRDSKVQEVTACWQQFTEPDDIVESLRRLIRLRQGYQPVPGELALPMLESIEDSFERVHDHVGLMYVLSGVINPVQLRDGDETQKRIYSSRERLVPEILNRLRRRHEILPFSEVVLLLNSLALLPKKYHWLIEEILLCLGKQLQKVKGNRLKLMAMNYFQTAPYIVKACGVAGVVEATCLDTVADMCLCHILEVPYEALSQFVLGLGLLSSGAGYSFRSVDRLASAVMRQIQVTPVPPDLTPVVRMRILKGLVLSRSLTQAAVSSAIEHFTDVYAFGSSDIIDNRFVADLLFVMAKSGVVNEDLLRSMRATFSGSKLRKWPVTDLAAVFLYSLQLSASTEASILTGNCLQHIGRSLNNSTPRAIIDVLEAIAIIYNSPKRFEHYQGDRPVRLVLRCCRDIIRWAPFCEPTDLQRARELIATLETLIPRLTVPVWFRSNALHDTD
ncbi:hypothetical protein Pmar_PMAR011311, partial [Perkinsus marinus ATCC 50983]